MCYEYAQIQIQRHCELVLVSVSHYYFGTKLEEDAKPTSSHNEIFILISPQKQ